MEVLKLLGILLLLAAAFVILMLFLFVAKLFLPLVIGIPLGLYTLVEVDDNLGVIIILLSIPAQFWWSAPRFGVQDEIDRILGNWRRLLRDWFKR